MAIFFGLARLDASSEPYLWILIIVGIALVAVSTRGPWDSDASGRNRSVLGFHARPEKKQITSKLSEISAPTVLKHGDRWPEITVR